MKTRLVVALLFAAVTLSALAASAAQAQVVGQPQWQMQGCDAQRSGRSLYVGSQTGTTQWTAALGGKITGSPVVGSDGAIFVGCDDKRIYSIDPVDGHVRWSHETSGTVSTPALSTSGTVYAIGGGVVFAFDVDNGNLTWKHQFGHYGDSVVVGPDGTVYAADDAGLFALDPSDGSVKWETGAPGFDNTMLSPAIGFDGTVYAVTGRCRVYAYDPSTGAQEWVSSVIPGGSEADYTYVHLTLGTDGTIFAAQLDGYSEHLYALNQSNGTLKWHRSDLNGALEGGVAVGSDGTAYFGVTDGTVWAVRSSDGAVRWKRSTGGGVECAPAIGADGKIYIGSNDHKLRALYRKTGSVVWVRDLHAEVKAGPAIGANGQLYAAAGNTLWAFDSHITPVVLLSGKSTIDLGHMYNLHGAVDVRSTPGTMTVVWKRYSDGAYRPVRTAFATIRDGAFSRDYKPTKRGRWRVSVSYPGGFRAPVIYEPSRTVNKSFTVE